MSTKFKRALLAALAIVALALGGAAIAQATGGDDERDGDEHVTDSTTVQRASDAALRAAGGGSVTEVEVADEGDEGYEVGVRRQDGSEAEVHLGTGFGVVSVQSDDD
jgi:uncharacterized membrane protein YkoI